MDTDEAVRLRRAVVQLARSLNVVASEERLTPTQASVLGIVAARGPLPIAEVARIERLNASMTSRVVAALDDRGLIERTPHVTDRRTATLTITAAGRAMHRRVRARRAGVMQEVADRLSPEHHELLISALPAFEALADLTD